MSKASGLKVAVIDYQAGNLTSCTKAFDHIANQMGYKGVVEVVHRAEQITDASHLVLPGQGAFGDCANQLEKIDGMLPALEEFVFQKGRPFFGICVGMQLLADRGLEFGKHQGLSWIPGEVIALEPRKAANGEKLKIPHMGWNNLDLVGDAANHPVLKGVRSGDHAYFVHSFHFDHAYESDLLATCDYGGPCTAIVGQNNIFGTQFHPEKSQSLGLRLIENFLAWKP